MGGVGKDIDSPGFFEGVGGLAECAGSIDDVVDEETGAAFDVTDNVHDLRLIGAAAPFVDNGQVAIIQTLGDGARAYDAADVGRDYRN